MINKRLITLIPLFMALGFGIYIYLSQTGDDRPVKLNKGRETISSVMTKIDPPAQARWSPYFKQAGFSLPDITKLTYIALKDEKLFEIWAKVNDKWKLLRIMPVLGASGGIGHKLRQGDWQVPEGIYKLDYFNPNSKAHMSIHINYPNSDDLAWARSEKRGNLGGDIMIHGSKSSIGCLAMGDVGMEDIFWLSQKIGLKNIHMIIAPYDLRQSLRPMPDGKLKQRYQQIEAAMQKISGVLFHN